MVARGEKRNIKRDREQTTRGRAPNFKATKEDNEGLD